MEVYKKEIAEGLVFQIPNFGVISLGINENYRVKANEIKDFARKNNIKFASLKGNIDENIFEELIDFEIIILMYNEVFDSNKIYKLIKIRDLCIDFSYKMKIDFSNFKELEKIDIQWNNNLIFKGANKLWHLKLRKYDKDVFELELPNEIEYLELIQGKLKSLKGIERNHSLKALVLYSQPKIEDYESIGMLENLEFLHIHGGHLKDLSHFTKLKKLKWIVLENCKFIETLKPLMELENLKGVQLVGATKILDGDRSLRDIKNEYKYMYPCRYVSDDYRTKNF